MTDPTEPARRRMVAQLALMAPLMQDREAAELMVDGRVWDTRQLQEDYEVEGFLAPFCVVVRKSDQQRGSLMFTHAPRWYFGFEAVPAEEAE